MRLSLILAKMAVVTAVIMMMLKTAQTRAIMMKSNVTPIELKTFF